MPRFIRLASLTDKGAANVANLKEQLGEAKQAMAKHGVTPVDACVTLPHDDIPAIIEAADGEVSAAAGAGVTAEANLGAETPTATSVTDLFHQIGAS